MSMSETPHAPSGTTDQKTWFDRPMFCTACERPLSVDDGAFVCDPCYAELQAEVARALAPRAT